MDSSWPIEPQASTDQSPPGRCWTNTTKQVSSDQSPPSRWVLTKIMKQVGSDQSPSGRQVMNYPQPAQVILTSHQHRILINTFEMRALEVVRPGIYICDSAGVSEWTRPSEIGDPTGGAFWPYLSLGGPWPFSSWDCLRRRGCQGDGPSLTQHELWELLPCFIFINCLMLS